MGKGRIIAGAGILISSIIAFILSRRRPPEPVCNPGETECRGNDLYVCSTQGQWDLEEENSPSCIVNPTGCLQGYVLNKITGAKIPRGNALITIDHTQSIHNTVDELGGYRTPYLLQGIHHFTVEADDFVTGEFDLEISKPVSNYNFELDPLPPAPPGEWSEGVEVQSVSVEPSVAYQGEIVDINVYIQYGIHDPNNYPTPATIFGTVKVNGQELKYEFHIDYRNTTLRFQYMASQVGEFTAIAQDKSTKFIVAQSPIGTYYCPFGGRRTSVCTELTIPDVEPFGSHPGGDYIMEGRGAFLVADKEIEERLNDAYPSAWDVGIVGDRPGVDWSIHKTSHYGVKGSWLYAAARAYRNCPPYWDSKEELAQVIAGLRGKDTWDVPTGSAFPSGLHGYDVIRGIAGWEKPTYESTGFQGHVDAILHCPYCDGGIAFSNRSPIPYLDMARELLEHIEQEHPDHPLTQPAWFLGGLIATWPLGNKY